MPEASFPVEVVSGVPVVTAPREIDITNAAGLRAALLEAAGHGSRTLVVDMTRTRFCDSAGLHVLVSAHQRARADGSELLLVICTAAVLRTFALTGIDRLIPNFPNLDQALAPALPVSEQPARRAGCRARGPGNAGDPLMTSSTLLGTADVLLVQDDPGDVLLTREAFEDHHLGLQLHVVGDGEAAMRFLRRTDDFAGMARPALVLLDLNLPRRGGLEVLGELKADPGLRTIPVVVLTTSQAETDILRSYELHANAYVIKPFDAARFADAIRHIDDFFLTLVKRPQ